MADFLNRLIQRTSGQKPAIKPLVRSAYSLIQPINQSNSEFEESVTFNEETGPFPAAIQTPAVSQEIPEILKQTPEISQTGPAGSTGKSDLIDKRDDVSKSKTQEIRLARDISQPPARLNQKPRNAADTSAHIPNDRTIVSEEVNEKISKRENETSEGIPVKPETKLKTQNDTVTKITWPGSQKRTLENTRSTLIFEKKENTGIVTNLKADSQMNSSTPSINQQDVPVTKQPVRLVLPGEETDEPGKAETTEIDPSGERNLVKNYRPEAIPASRNERITPEIVREAVLPRMESSQTTNVKVTIGRVEIKAIKQPERQIIRTPSIPRKPVVSLDAYLKGRDEGDR